MTDRFVAPTNQFRSTMGSIPTSVPSLLYPVESGGHWGWSDTGPADGATVTVGGDTYVDEGETEGLRALEIAGRLVVM